MSETALVTDDATHTSSVPSKYDRLAHADIGTVLRLADEGLSQTLIAQHVGCHQSTVSRVLRELGPDTSELAVRRFKSSALDSADRVIGIAEKSEDEPTALKAARTVLEVAGVLSTGQGVKVGVQVVLGTGPQQPIDAASIIVSTQNP